MWPYIVTNFFIIKPTICTTFTNLFFMKLYMFRRVPLSIIRSLFTVHSAMVYVIQVFRQLSSRTRIEWYSDLVTGWTSRDSSPCTVKKCFSSPATPDLLWGQSDPLFNWYRSSSRGYSDWGVKVITYFELVPKVVNGWRCTSTPGICHHGLREDNSNIFYLYKVFIDLGGEFVYA